MKKIPNIFTLTFFEDSQQKISDTITKGRVSIFYKGLNRNGTYISDSFADKLIQTLPYTPVKGIYSYSEENPDYKGHKRDESDKKEERIYGIVPDKSIYNFAWEKKLDEDGVEREYACVDVYIYTAIYEEGEKIIGKSQSMEIYEESIKGEWIENEVDFPYFKFTDGSFLSLQVLGDKVKPCFQSAQFYSQDNEENIRAFFESINSLLKTEEEPKMENTFTFSLSDRQKSSQISKLLNKDTFRYYLLETFDNYAIALDLETEELLKYNFEKDKNSVTSVSEEGEKVTLEYLTNDEKAALENLKEKSESSTYQDISQSWDTLFLDNQNIRKDFEALKTKYSTLEQNVKAKEEIEKNNLINKYSQILKPETIEKIKNESFSNYSASELEKELSYEYVKESENAIFQKKDFRVPLEKQDGISDLAATILKHKK